MIDFLLRIFEEHSSSPALIWQEETFDYAWLQDRVRYWRDTISSSGVPRGAVVVLEADFSPNGIALFLALVEHTCMLVPLTSSVAAKRSEFIEIAEGEFSFRIDDADDVTIDKLPRTASNSLYEELRRKDHPGLVLFSSGSTGESKAAVHDLTGLLEKFKVSRHRMNSLTFLLFDHIGGVNTMLYQLSNGGCIVTIRDRDPDSVLATIERHRVDLLPTSPTFLNLVLLSEAYKRHDLSSLKTITYGTEPMPESTLKRLHHLIPNVRLLQTYGLSEVGILRSRSKSSDSLWVKVGGEGFDTRVVDGVLHIKAESAMQGYLNAPSPFTEDGWFNTGDLVEVDDEFVRFMGRESEVINVGGEKVYPAEVESVIQEMDYVSEATVYGEENAIIGNIVCARVRLSRDEDSRGFASRLREYCRTRLQPYKVPVKVKLTEDKLYGERFKKERTLSSPSAQE